MDAHSYAITFDTNKPMALRSLLMDTASTCPWKLTAPTFPVDTITTESGAIARLQDWSQKCENTHEKCRSILKTSKLPTRVVEILDQRSVRLKETANEQAPYVCLSHCWGKTEFLQTNVATVSKHKVSIAWSDLPKTFQDAIGVTYQLGIRYIWIDSLCILQGDMDDWLREGSRMCDIYSNAHFTIAATWSTGPTHGCYAPRGHLLELTCEFPDAQDEQYLIHARGEPEIFSWFDPVGLHINDYELSSETGVCFPLLQRAWAFQERILSPRVVHFGHQELLWECMELKTCECSKWPGYGAPAEGRYFETPSMKMDSTPITFDGDIITLPDYWKWRRIIEQFTSKSLRYPTDIFPALQGVAKSLQDGRKYHAGLWGDKNLLSSLLWRARHWSERRNYCGFNSHMGPAPYNPPAKLDQESRTSTWRAPTWSWASVTTPVIFDVQHIDSNETLASIVSIQTVPASSDPLGQLKSGHLKLQGRCAEARLCVGYVNDRCHQQRKDDPIKLLIGTKYDDHSSSVVVWDVRNRPKEVSDRRKYDHSDPKYDPLAAIAATHAMVQRSRGIDVVEDTGFVKTFYADYDLALNGRTVRLMEILRWDKRNDDGTSTEMSSYLVFDCVDETQDIYERIGCVHTDKRIDPDLFVNEGEELILHIV